VIRAALALLFLLPAALPAAESLRGAKIRVRKGDFQRRWLPGSLGQITTPDGTEVRLIGANIPTGWNDYWMATSEADQRRDLEKVRSMGLNAVRIFIPFVPPSGRAHPANPRSGEYLRRQGYLEDRKLPNFVQAAENLGMSVTVCFFDLNRDVPSVFKDSDPLFRAQTEYLGRIAAALKDRRWVIYDLMNEPEPHLLRLDPERRELAREWMAELSRHLRRRSGGRHLLVLGSMSAELLEQSGVLDDRELMSELDGLSIHTGDFREVFSERAGDLPDWIRRKNLGLILFWGEFGSPSIAEPEGAPYLSRAVRQIELNDLAGGFVWEFKSFNPDGSPLTDHDGNPHTWGIENRPEAVEALGSAARKFATDLRNPKPLPREVRGVWALPKDLGEPVLLPGAEGWTSRRLILRIKSGGPRGSQVFTLKGDGPGPEPFGVARPRDPISVDLGRERLLLDLDVAKLEGRYFLLLWSGERSVYVVRDSSRRGRRGTIDLTRILADAGFEGRLDDLRLEVGVLNSSPDARSAEGARATVRIRLLRVPGREEWALRPGQLLP
jgi:hypothetical protein